MSEVFPAARQLQPREDGLVAVGGQLSADLVLEAYSKGVFPWTGEEPIPWFSPDPRMVLLPAGFRATRSLRKTARSGRYAVQMDHAFERVMAGCADQQRPGQEGTWIVGDMPRVWLELHGRGFAHSVSTWEGDELVGGLYGLSLGRAFFGESMFAIRSDASKLALWRLCEMLERRGFHFVDCQQETDHLASLGATPIARLDYLDRLDGALSHVTLRGPWNEPDMEPPDA